METKMVEFETRALPQALDVREEDGETISVSGYAAIFGEETNIGGMFTEVIERGAFASALERQDDVVFLINHDGLPLARTIQDLQLYDVAIVTTPAYEGTDIGLRSLEAHRASETKVQAARRLRMKSKL
jgi:phage head maturation protease